MSGIPIKKRPTDITGGFVADVVRDKFCKCVELRTLGVGGGSNETQDHDL
jgi:hypothetical protein